MPSLPFVLALRGVETLINQALHYDPATQQRLLALSGKAIFIETQSPRLAVMVLIQDSRVRLLAESIQKPHATIEAESTALLKLALSRELQLVGGPLRVHGQVQLIEQLHAIAKQLDIDWEEPIAELLGDSSAHEIGKHLRGFLGFAKKTAKTFLLNSAEYLREERELIPAQWELDELSTDNQDLRADTERLQARVQRLQQRLERLPAASKPTPGGPR